MSGAGGRAVTPITKLLVANRGEIARRVVHTARRLSIPTVAVHSDADAGAPHVREADEAVRLPGVSAAETYLDIDRMLGAALATGATAVHPGYGFLSENAAFARACEDAGLVFIGPPSAAIEAMASKVAAKQRMAAAGVPVLESAEVDSAEEVATAGRRLGWPLLVKAAFGGGGRGMRVVASAAEAAAAFEAARGEAVSAFGDGTLFVERFVVSPRHVEVQVFGDHHGTVVHLFERECSIQRRYQKIIEECPSPAVDESLREALGKAAVAAAAAIGYVGAGTVEFVLDRDGQFFFLEVNTRLQVEHPVTEAVTGLDLVALQLAVAAGEPLPPEARTAELRGHAIEARLYAEDVAAGFLPVSGTVERFEVPAGLDLRVDRGVEAGSVVSTYYDAMLAKVIARAPTRALAARRLSDALRRARLHGVTTNRDLLVGVLEHPEFLEGRTDTGFLDRHDPAALSHRPAAGVRRLHAAAAVLAASAARLGSRTVQPAVPPGWRNVGEGWQSTVLADTDGPIEVAHRYAGPGRAGTAGEGFAGPATAAPVEVTVEVTVEGERLVGRVPAATPDEVVLERDGVAHRVVVAWYGSEAWVDGPLGASRFTEVPRFAEPGPAVAAGSLLAPMPGSVARVLAAPGDRVSEGQVLVVLEAMKMEHSVRSPRAGTLDQVLVSPGAQVEAGAVLAVVGAASGGGPDGDGEAE